MNDTNPNGANQYKIDPRQVEFLKNYLDPDSDTFGNARKSGIKAGYSKTYAENIMNLLPEWLSKNIEDSELVTTAKENLKDFLKQEDNNKIKFDATKFALERIAREEFGRNVDVTTKGEKINQELDQHREELKQILEDAKTETTKTDGEAE